MLTSKESMKNINLFDCEQLGDLFWSSNMEKDYLNVDWATDYWQQFTKKNPLNYIRTKFGNNY